MRAIRRRGDVATGLNRVTSVTGTFSTRPTAVVACRLHSLSRQRRDAQARTLHSRPECRIGMRPVGRDLPITHQRAVLHTGSVPGVGGELGQLGLRGITTGGFENPPQRRFRELGRFAEPAKAQ